MEKPGITQEEINSIVLKACDTFRGVVDPSEYKNYILVFLFLKYLTDVWTDKYDQYKNELGHDEERIRRKMQRERFIIPPKCDFYRLSSKTDPLFHPKLIHFNYFLPTYFSTCNWFH